MHNTSVLCTQYHTQHLFLFVSDTNKPLARAKKTFGLLKPCQYPRPLWNQRPRWREPAIHARWLQRASSYGSSKCFQDLSGLLGFFNIFWLLVLFSVFGFDCLSHVRASMPDLLQNGTAIEIATQTLTKKSMQHLVPKDLLQWLVKLSVAIQTLFPAWGFEERKPFFRPPPNPSTFRLDSSVSFLFCSRAAKARCIMASATSFRSSTASCPSAPSVGSTVLSLFSPLLPLMPSSCLASGLRRVASSGGTSSSSSIDPLGCCPEGKKSAKIRDSLDMFVRFCEFVVSLVNSTKNWWGGLSRALDLNRWSTTTSTSTTKTFLNSCIALFH